MKIAIGCDHGALELKNTIVAHLQEKGYTVVDFGTHSLDSCDYPDYAAMAAVVALGHLGVKVPDDVRLVVFSNRGHGPVAWNSLARIENDVRSHGDIVSAAVLSFLESGTFPSAVRLEASFIPGESL